MAQLIVGAAIAALIYQVAKPSKPVSPLCNTGNCNEKAAATPVAATRPMILDPPRVNFQINDTVPIGDQQPFGNSAQIAKIRQSVTMNQQKAAANNEGIALGSGAIF